MKTLSLLIAAILSLWGFSAAAQLANTEPRPRNGSSQRYEINQTFDGQVFRKDNNIWSYTKEFADLFGMPAAYIEPIEGVAAAAYRVEQTQHQDCGFGGKADVCNTGQICILDLYFDETKNPLPWAQGVQSGWKPMTSSTRWLRAVDPKEKPKGILVVEPEIEPFVDPATGQSAMFTTNSGRDVGNKESISSAMYVYGYTKFFYRNLSIVSLHFDCVQSRKTSINVRLDAKKYPFDPPIAQFNRVELPETYVQRIHARMQEIRERNAQFFRNLLRPVQPTSAAPTANTSTISK